MKPPPLKEFNLKLYRAIELIVIIPMVLLSPYTFPDSLLILISYVSIGIGLMLLQVEYSIRKINDLVDERYIIYLWPAIVIWLVFSFIIHGVALLILNICDDGSGDHYL